MPKLAVIDPQFTMTAPPKITAATGLDALCHAIEAYTSRKAQTLSDTFALSAVKRIFNFFLPFIMTGKMRRPGSRCPWRPWKRELHLIIRP